MKKLFTICSIAVVAAINLFYSTGSPGGRTGSPFDGTNCTVGCHVGNTRLATTWISTDAPSAGIVAGETYRITLSASDISANKFGFELTAESSTDGKEGTFTIVDAAETQLTVSGSVTHTANGTTGTSNARTWRVDWTAPSDLPADITFYAAVNAADNSGDATGDLIYTSKTQVNIAPVGFQEKAENSIAVFPNPVANELFVSQKTDEIKIMNLNGQLLKTITNTDVVDTRDLAEGTYLVTLTNASETSLKKIIVSR